MSKQKQWFLIIDDVSKTVPGFKVDYKRNYWYMKLFATLLFWVDFNEYWQGFGRTVYLPNRVDLGNIKTHDVRSLQHEATHVLDSCTFFGLLPWAPWWFNTVLFSVVYLFPFPGLGRAWVELRAYRRNVEYTGIRPYHVKAFQTSEYLWMLPLPRPILRRLLSKPSAYGERFNKALDR